MSHSAESILRDLVRKAAEQNPAAAQDIHLQCIEIPAIGPLRDLRGGFFHFVQAIPVKLAGYAEPATGQSESFADAFASVVEEMALMLEAHYGVSLAAPKEQPSLPASAGRSIFHQRII